MMAPQTDSACLGLSCVAGPAGSVLGPGGGCGGCGAYGACTDNAERCLTLT